MEIIPYKSKYISIIIINIRIMINNSIVPLSVWLITQAFYGFPFITAIRAMEELKMV